MTQTVIPDYFSFFSPCLENYCRKSVPSIYQLLSELRGWSFQKKELHSIQVNALHSGEKRKTQRLAVPRTLPTKLTELAQPQIYFTLAPPTISIFANRFAIYAFAPALVPAELSSGQNTPLQATEVEPTRIIECNARG
jgi:hypothetical protein